MSDLTLNSPGGGSLTLVVPNTNKNINLTLPDAGTGIEVSNSSVLAAVAGASAGAVGTHALLYVITVSTLSAGQTFAGSDSRWAGASGPANSGNAVLGTGTTPAGTWRVLGYVPSLNGEAGATVCLRIV